MQERLHLDEHKVCRDTSLEGDIGLLQDPEKGGCGFFWIRRPEIVVDQSQRQRQRMNGNLTPGKKRLKRAMEFRDPSRITVFQKGMMQKKLRRFISGIAERREGKNSQREDYSCNISHIAISAFL
jgi:hypothetical protein